MKLNKVAQFNLQQLSEALLDENEYILKNHETYYEIIIKTQSQLKSTELFHLILYLLKILTNLYY